MVNLLPQEERRTLTRIYYIRFARTFSLLLAALAALGTCIMLPVLAVVGFEAYTTADARADTSAVQEADHTLEASLETFAAQTNLAEALLAKPKATELFDHALARAGAGVSVTSFSFSENAEEAGEITLSGVAATRDDLVRFARALEALPAFASVELPIARLAKERNLPFSLAIVLNTEQINPEQP